ncbi:DUF7716 domain-containing protein [Myroides odoratimimus]|uniref:DUF7716 domain-containing protein n=1 Tax=Myroides odoratimimus CIP 101113 TaxID=883154 RepID=A0AAV3EZ65_9FLAO|nr:hypothetical protein [Myroides odoratimimus]EHO05633.1 hypothetical protein HMPREF9715_03269 [Myroides odoratimimus CIP 101113]SHL13500.1 hypothetical protein SAMN05444275_102224 [Myroides odoratimimus subsp. xuanwuensis]
MTPDFKNKTYRLAEFILLVKDRKERTTEYGPAYQYAIYAVEDEADVELEIYVGDPVEVTEDNEEVYPDAVTELDMWYLCSDEDIQDVVDLAVSQKPTVTVEELVMALDYYLTIDDFIDFD